MHDYKIIVLGPSGAGKTVFLASMYHKLSVQKDDIGFYLTLPPDQSRVLIGKYVEIKAKKWPRPTQRAEVSEWTFTCNVENTNRQSFAALTYSYLDYAGEIITEARAGDESSARFDREVSTAEVLIGMLDGHKILSLLSKSNHPSGTTIDSDLDYILPLMQRSGKPAHFLITKWDLLQDRYTLAEVRAKLLEDENFKQLVTRRRQQDNPVRLIPVSSVGKGFALLQPNGVMQPVPGVIPEPFQVEMSLACVLYDGLHARLTEILKRKEQIERQVVRNAPNYTIKESLGRFFGGLLREVKSFLPLAYRFSDPILYKMIDNLEAPAIRREHQTAEEAEEQRKRREESLRTVQSEETAMNHVIERCKELMARMRAAFPGSDFSDMRF